MCENTLDGIADQLRHVEAVRCNVAALHDQKLIPSHRGQRARPLIRLQVHRDLSQVTHQCRQRLLRHCAGDPQIQQGHERLSRRQQLTLQGSHRQDGDGRRQPGRRLLRQMRSHVSPIILPGKRIPLHDLYSAFAHNYA